MTKLIIDGIEVDVPAEYTVLQACEAAGAEVPRFCFHERLSIAGNCRMCLVEVKGGPPKPQASCAIGVRDLRPDHPMVALERTVYPTTVVSPWESPRLLVSGANNAKLGGEVLKGPWSGAPLFHLTLEERATCPRSCLQWLSCYGNAMHLARRHDHRDPNFLNLLEAELWLLQREHRETGFVVRLHTLGDFYSLDYVQFWADALDHFPGLRVFGYTANDPRSKNVEEAAVGKAIEWLTQRAWDVFAIRFSRAEPLPQSSNVLMEPSDDERVIMCPQQREATLACGACGLCWADPARDKAIGFLKHGPKAPGPRA